MLFLKCKGARCRSITETKPIPYVINPLSVSTNSIDKKRLILDLRFVRSHIFTEKIKCEVWKFGKDQKLYVQILFEKWLSSCRYI